MENLNVLGKEVGIVGGWSMGKSEYIGVFCVVEWWLIWFWYF